MSSKDNIIESLTKTIETMSNELVLLGEQVTYLRQKLPESTKTLEVSIYSVIGRLRFIKVIILFILLNYKMEY
ncbi:MULTISPECIES: hypothetical protein [Streptococcus]|uniref:Uncharacterized protein n=1 Tax=Streptococcus caledonicus TaxID=2614158 RepID=A0ABW0UES7_9STRE|nr:hypothetical protein [Streptococcus sp. S784/96/1]